MAKAKAQGAYLVAIALCCGGLCACGQSSGGAPNPRDAAATGVDLASPIPDVPAGNEGDTLIGGDDGVPAADVGATDGNDAGPPGPCALVDGQAEVTIGTADSTDDFALTLPAQSASKTSWGTKDNEALVLDVSGPSGLIGHLVLHQGADPFGYTMHLGKLNAGDDVTVRVSTLSAKNATPKACVGPATLASATSLGDAGDGVKNAPILRWPREKSFDDLPMLLGWSQQDSHYELYYTNENGGTAYICGGGAKGMQAEIARWGRGCDIEGVYTYKSTPATWERCDGYTDVTAHPLRLEGQHPILYYGDAHNRPFESRGGYAQTCGTTLDKQADGNFAGWNVQNPGNDEVNDAPFVITIRPLPYALDPLGFPAAGGRREGVLDTYAPWLYRITSLELEREGKIDGTLVVAMERYLYVDIKASDVGGGGDSYCDTFLLNGGFDVRILTTAGDTFSGPQMTADYFGSGTDWKRMAIPLDRHYTKDEIQSISVFAYDNDGIYFLALGDAFMPTPAGDNGATLDYIHRGTTDYGVYVDADESSCSAGVNTDGPDGGAADGGTAYPCVGVSYAFTP